MDLIMVGEKHKAGTSGVKLKNIGPETEVKPE